MSSRGCILVATKLTTTPQLLVRSVYIHRCPRLPARDPARGEDTAAISLEVHSQLFQGEQPVHVLGDSDDSVAYTSRCTWSVAGYPRSRRWQYRKPPCSVAAVQDGVGAERRSAPEEFAPDRGCDGRLDFATGTGSSLLGAVLSQVKEGTFGRVNSCQNEK